KISVWQACDGEVMHSRGCDTEHQRPALFWRTEDGRPQPQRPGGPNHRGEQHDLGCEEEPHPQLPGADPRKLRLDRGDSAIERARWPLQVLMDPATKPAAKDREADEEHRDADGDNPDVADAHPDCDDHGPRAPVVLLFLARGFRVRHLPRTGAWLIRLAITSS